MNSMKPAGRIISVAGVGGLLMGSATLLAQDGGTSLQDMVAYAVDDDTHTIVRYQFSDNTMTTVGPIALENGTVLTEIESLVRVPGSLHLYGVWNYEGNTRSRLVRINLLTAEAKLLDSDTGFGNVEGLTMVQNVNRGPGPLAITAVVLHDSSGNDAFEISFVDVTYNGDGTSSWTYHVRELSTGKDLSHWNLALGECHTVMPGTTSGYEVGIDGSTGFYGIKWNVTDGFSESDFTIVLDKQYGGTEGGTGIGVLAKGGNSPDEGLIFGPTCNVPQDEVLYVTHTDGWGKSDLISIDPETGIGKHEMDLSRRYEGVAAGPDGTLYGVSGDDLYRIDPFSDVEDFLGEGDFMDVEALEFAVGEDSPAVMIPGVDPA